MNDVIDEVARGMTADVSDDTVAFRRRVLARVESGGAPRRTWRAAFVLSPIAVAAAIIIVAFVVLGRRPGPFGPGAQGPERPVPQTPPIVAASPPETAGPKGPALQAAVNTAAQPAVRRPGPEGPALQIDPNAVASIAVAPLAVDALAPDPIPIDRLDAVPPIVVAPLDITDTQRRFE